MGSKPFQKRASGPGSPKEARTLKVDRTPKPAVTREARDGEAVHIRELLPYAEVGPHKKSQ